MLKLKSNTQWGIRRGLPLEKPRQLERRKWDRWKNETLKYEIDYEIKIAMSSQKEIFIKLKIYIDQCSIIGKILIHVFEETHYKNYSNLQTLFWSGSK